MGMTLQLQSTADSDTAFGTIGTGPISFVGNISPVVQAVNLSSGANTITPPSSAIGVVICPPTSSSSGSAERRTSSGCWEVASSSATE